MSSMVGAAKTAGQIKPVSDGASSAGSQQKQLPKKYMSASGGRASFKARRESSLLGVGMSPSDIQNEKPARMATPEENQRFWKAFATGRLAEWEKDL